MPRQIKLSDLVKIWLHDEWPVLQGHFTLQFQHNIPYEYHFYSSCKTYPLLGWLHDKESYVTFDLERFYYPTDPNFFDDIRRELIQGHKGKEFCDIEL
jgi:hypothetical protein